MRHFFLLLFLLIPFFATAQDIIVTKNNEEISAKVKEIHIETISYKKSDNLTGPTYHIEKSEVSKIIFANGSVESFNATSSKAETKTEEVSMEDTQAFLKEYIEAYCYDDNGYLKNKYKAHFEGDYLRLIVMNKDQTKELSNHLFNFKNVYSFRRPDRRADNLAYLNFYAPYLANKKKDKWAKLKLVISVEGHENAQSIVNALKHYNYLLKQKAKKPGQKF